MSCVLLGKVVARNSKNKVRSFGCTRDTKDRAREERSMGLRGCESLDTAGCRGIYSTGVDKNGASATATGKDTVTFALLSLS